MPITGGGGASALDDLSDVIISAATAGDVLNFDGTNWLNTGTPHIGPGYSARPIDNFPGDISTYGRLYVGQSVSEADTYMANTIIVAKQDLDNGSAKSIRSLINLTGTGSAAVLGSTLLAIFTGGSGYTSGTFSLNGLEVNMNITIPAGVSCSYFGTNFSYGITGAGNINTGAGVVGAAAGSGTAGSTCLELIGALVNVNSRASTTTFMAGVRVQNFPGFTHTAPVTVAVAYDVNGSFANSTQVTEWFGLRISTGITAAIANKWSLSLTNVSTNMGSRIAHKIALGWTPATVAAITARVMVSAGGTAVGSGPIKFQTGGPLTVPEAGVQEFALERFYLTPTSLERQVIPGVLFTSTADGTVTNTLVETTLVGAGVGDTTLNANFFVPAKTIRVRASGWVDTAAAAGTLQIRLRLGGIAGTVILDSTAVVIANNLAARYWNVDAIITCRTVGVGGTVIGQSAFQHMVAAQGNPVWWEMTNIAAIVLDTTIAEQVVLSAQWGTADAANIIACTNFILEVLN